MKQLAGTTSASISDIEARIEAIQRAANEGVAALSRIETLIEQVSESQNTVAAAIEEQSAVTAQIAEVDHRAWPTAPATPRRSPRRSHPR